MSRSGPGLVQVWFSLQLKFSSSELDSEVGRLVPPIVNNHLFLRPNFFLPHPHADTFRIPAGLTSHAVLFSNHSTSVLKLADTSLLLTYCDPEKESVRGDY